MAMTTWTMRTLGTSQNHAVHRLQSGNGADWPTSLRPYSKLEASSANFPAFLPACLLFAVGRMYRCVCSCGSNTLAGLAVSISPSSPQRAPPHGPTFGVSDRPRTETVEPRCPAPP